MHTGGHLFWTFVRVSGLQAALRQTQSTGEQMSCKLKTQEEETSQSKVTGESV